MMPVYKSKPLTDSSSRRSVLGRAGRGGMWPPSASTSASPPQTAAPTQAHSPTLVPSSLQPALSPTSATLCTVQSTQACFSQMPDPQPLLLPSMPTMPATLPPLIQLSPSGGAESLRMLVQHQEQADQDQAMFLFHPGRRRRKTCKAHMDAIAPLYFFFQSA